MILSFSTIFLAEGVCILCMLLIVKVRCLLSTYAYNFSFSYAYLHSYSHRIHILLNGYLTHLILVRVTMVFNQGHITHFCILCIPLTTVSMFSGHHVRISPFSFLLVLSILFSNCFQSMCDLFSFSFHFCCWYF